MLPWVRVQPTSKVVGEAVGGCGKFLTLFVTVPIVLLGLILLFSGSCW